MALTMKEKQAVTKQLALKYKKATKKEKGQILDSVIDLTGYNRSYAARVLRNRGKPKVLGKVRNGKRTITLVEDERTKRKKRRNRPRKYDEKVFPALVKVWAICDGICGKRLGPFLPEIIPVLESWGELKTTDEVRQKLLEISPATIDRMLQSAKKRYQWKGRSHTLSGDIVEEPDPDSHVQRLG